MAFRERLAVALTIVSGRAYDPFDPRVREALGFDPASRAVGSADDYRRAAEELLLAALCGDRPEGA